MATKVHDQDDQEFAEIDIILAQAKLELRRDRKLRRNMNLSDIPENFAHVPAYPESSTTRCTARAVSLDTPQSDFASRRADPSRHHKSVHKLHFLGLMAPMKWLRGYMSCLMAADAPSVQHRHPPRQRVAGYGV